MPQLIASAGGVEIRHVALKVGKTTLGRRPHNDLVFDNLVVSGEHCVFEMTARQEVYVKDVGSTNGTYVNGNLIESAQLLHDKDIIVIGDFSVRFVDDRVNEQSTTNRPTNVMSLDTLGFPGTSGARRAMVKVLSGSSAGRDIPLVKAVTTFGPAGASVISISHRRDGYYIAHVDGATVPTLNGKPIAREAAPLAHGDIVNLAETELEFLLQL